MEYLLFSPLPTALPTSRTIPHPTAHINHQQPNSHLQIHSHNHAQSNDRPPLSLLQPGAAIGAMAYFTECLEGMAVSIPNAIAFRGKSLL